MNQTNFFINQTHDFRYFGRELLNCEIETPHSNITAPQKVESYGCVVKQPKQQHPFSQLIQSKPIRYTKPTNIVQEEKENGNIRNKTEIVENRILTEEIQPPSCTNNRMGVGLLSYNTSFEELQFQTGKQVLQDELNSYDQLQKNNPQYVSLYSAEIFEYLKKQEDKYLLNEQYMNSQKQPDINAKMRAILVDWLIDVHLKFRLKDETLYICITLIDRYLNQASTTRQKLQLVGVAALLIACKYEEIYPPDLKDFAYITDNAYTIQEVLAMEGMILQQLEFCITQPSSYCFLQRYGRIAGLDQKNLILAQYLLELAMIDLKFITLKPSNLACSAIYLVHKIRLIGVLLYFIRKISNPWSETMIEMTGYSEQSLRPCAKELCLKLQTAEKQSLQAVRKKFSSSKYLEVSRIRVERQTN